MPSLLDDLNGIVAFRTIAPDLARAVKGLLAERDALRAELDRVRGQRDRLQAALERFEEYSRRAADALRGTDHA